MGLMAREGLYVSFVHHTVSRRKRIQSSVNNFNKLKRIFTVLGTHYPDGTSY